MPDNPCFRRRMSGAEDRRGSGEESGERAKESGERAKSSRKKEKEKTAEKEKSKETEKGKNKENETDQCKAGEKVTAGEDGQPAGGSNNANNTHDSPKKDASTDPLEDPGGYTDDTKRPLFPKSIDDIREVVKKTVFLRSG